MYRMHLLCVTCIVHALLKYCAKDHILGGVTKQKCQSRASLPNWYIAYINTCISDLRHIKHMFHKKKIYIYIKNLKNVSVVCENWTRDAQLKGKRVIHYTKYTLMKQWESLFGHWKIPFCELNNAGSMSVVRIYSEKLKEYTWSLCKYNRYLCSVWSITVPLPLPSSVSHVPQKISPLTATARQPSLHM